MSIKAIEKIGSGATSNVYIGIYNDEKYILKRISLDKWSTEKIFKEIEILKILSDCCGSYVPKYSGNSNNGIDHVITMEYLDHHITLEDYMKNNANSKNILSNKNKGILNELIIGLTNIHRCNICHRDVKPGNVLISTLNFKIKYIDFGLSIIKTDK